MGRFERVGTGDQPVCGARAAISKAKATRPRQAAAGRHCRCLSDGDAGAGSIFRQIAQQVWQLLHERRPREHVIGARLARGACELHRYVRKKGNDGKLRR